MDGDHSIEVCERVTQNVWETTIKALQDQHVLLEGILLKPSMVTPGADFKGPKATPEEIGRATVRMLSRTVPPAIPGIMFLSGGQGEEEATINLDAINKVAQQTAAPWRLSFSYGRALQASTIKDWEGSSAKVSKAQETFISRAKANSAAQLGKYSSGGATSESLYVKDYKY